LTGHVRKDVSEAGPIPNGALEFKPFFDRLKSIFLKFIDGLLGD
jgi:hypothetical protein